MMMIMMTKTTAKFRKKIKKILGTFLESLNDTRFSENRFCTWPAGIALPRRWCILISSFFVNFVWWTKLATPSAFYCTLNTHYRIVLYRSLQLGFWQKLLETTETQLGEVKGEPSKLSVPLWWWHILYKSANKTACINVKKTYTVYTQVNDDDRWYYSTTCWHLGDVLVGNITYCDFFCTVVYVPYRR